MSDSSSERWPEVDRRNFITGLTTFTTTSIAGCGDSKTSGQENERVVNGANNSTGRRDSLPDELTGPKEDIETVFLQLSDLPIFENEEFVFDVTLFEEEFEHQSMRMKAEKAIERLEKTSDPSLTEATIDRLIITAEIARLRIAQRVMVHQVIAGGLVLEKRIFQGEYERALGVTRDAEQFLENLRATGKQIEERLPGVERLEITVDGFDPSHIDNSQQHLVDIVRWADLAYEALSHAVLGFRIFDEGNAALKTERYDVAGISYGESEQRFEAAAAAFDEAQGTGRRIPHIAPLVDGVRCLLPAYLASSGRLQHAMKEFESGNEEQAKKTAREAISAADEKAVRCF